VVSEALARYLDVDVAADKWDEEPSLALIFKDPEGVVCFAPVPLGQGVWGAAEPHKVVWAAGQVALDLHRLSGWSPMDEGETLLGVVLFSEGWGLSETNPAEGGLLRRWVESGNRIAEHPQRVEFKLVSAVLTDGTVLMLTHQRGGVTESKPASGVEGRIPDSLRKALRDFQEVTG